MTADLEAEYKRLVTQQEKADERARKVSGWIFAPIGMISFPAALLGSLAFGIWAVALAIPGLIALGIAILVYWSMVRGSEARVEQAKQRLDQAKRAST